MELPLRKAEGGEEVRFWMEYDGKCKISPEAMLIEPDILAPLFDSMANPVYFVETSRVRRRFSDFGEANASYKSLVKGWNATETYCNHSVFRYEERADADQPT